MVKKIRKKDKYAKREAEKYEYPIVSREFILEFLEDRGKPTTQGQLEDAFDMQTKEQKEALRRRLLAMVRDGQLLQNRRGTYGLVKKMQLIKGYVVGHKDGFGFLVPDKGGDDLFLNARQMRTVFPDDEVLVRPGSFDHRGRREGIIVEVIQRNTRELVGRFIKEGGAYFVQPANQRIPQEILIPPERTQNAQHGQMVIVEITEQPTVNNKALGKVIEILGDHMAPGMEIDIAIRNHELPFEWPEKVLRQAKQFPSEVSEESCRGRLDLRHKSFVTIDGEDAKDFDDAVYCEPNAKGGWRLFVAIADVDHYVKEGSALDKEALNRGNSVYFPARVIPMLPEELSNELCSLKPEVNRLTMVCEMSISPVGKIMRYRFYEAVIKSNARMTYNQVYQILIKQDVNLQKQYQRLLPHLQALHEVFQILHVARKKRGAIDFDLPETKIIFGKDRKIEKIIAMQRNDAHRLIEEAMLCANICAARFILKNKCSGLFRIHEGPSLEKLMDLRKFLHELGLSLAGGEEPRPSDYAKLLQKITERPDAHLIQTILLRSLSQAIYSAENKGHFGLAFEAYTHFTSPIRRYPDLVVHRVIKSILRRDFIEEETNPRLEQLGEHCSMTERRADDATREAIDWLKCEYMLDKVGEEFDGIITSVMGFGLFIELVGIYVEGLVHISMLKNDYYHFDPIKHALTGEYTGKRYRIGDAVKVKVARVDLDKREIDFIIIDALAAKSTKRKKKKV